MRTTAPAERYARNQIEAMAGERPPLYRHPDFPTREVRAASVRCDDVLADRVTGEPMTVVGVGWSSGAAVVLYVRCVDATHPGATSKLHYSARDFVRRAVTSPALPGAVTPV